MKSSTITLLASIVALVICLFALPSYAQNPPLPRDPYLSHERFTVTAGLGQHYDSPTLRKLTDASPVLFGWGTADYRITDSFLASVDARRNIDGGGWGTDLKLGYKFGIGSAK